MKLVNWDSVIDNIQAGLVWFVIVVVTICTATLILFDVLAGMGIMDYLTSGNMVVATLISLATTGLLLALMFIGYTMQEKKSTGAKSVGWVLLLIAFLVYCVDVVFDSLTADVLRFSMIVSTNEIPNPYVHMLFRGLLAGISTVGEALAVSIIIGMPVLKTFINNALPVSRRMPINNQPRQYNAAIPSSIPRAGKPHGSGAKTMNPKVSAPVPRNNPSVFPEPAYHPVSFSQPDDLPEFDGDILAQTQFSEEK
jgi:hypothetical protein